MVVGFRAVVNTDAKRTQALRPLSGMR